jgi:serpin B
MNTQESARVRSCALAALLCALVVSATPQTIAVGQSAGLTMLTQAYNASGQDVFDQLVAAPGNVIFSPASVGMAMAMALSGARNDTEREMVAALRHRLTRAEVDAANTAWLTAVNAYGNGVAAPVTLTIANAIATSRRISSQYAASLREHYGADILEQSSVEALNAWASAKTQGKITRVVDRIAPDVAAVIVNAIYFKGRWAVTFDSQATKDAYFRISPSVSIAVPTMHSQSAYSTTPGDGYAAIRLPYSGGAVAMVVVLPDDVGGTEQVAGKLTGDMLTKLVDALATQAPRPVALSLPRFKSSFRVSLAEPFERLGIHKAFKIHEADFSGMTGRPPAEVPMAIDEIIHSVVVEVSEEGAEAAAVTAITARTTTAFRPPPASFTIDRPFLFYIVDSRTGAILFQGRIADPRAK